MTIKSLTIYCSSSNNLKQEYYSLAEKIGEYLAHKSIKIIYGGGKSGLMGKVSKSAFFNGGKVIGIIPEFLATKEKISFNTTKTIIVKNMLERKKKLFDMGDAFLILPGGSGTIEEITEVVSWKFLGIHNKDIIFFNYKKFWDLLFKIYEEFVNKKFGEKNLHYICKDIKEMKELEKKYFLNV